MHVRPNRVEYYRRICRKAGMEPSSRQGYFSRREMMELLVFIDAMVTGQAARSQKANQSGGVVDVRKQK